MPFLAARQGESRVKLAVADVIDFYIGKRSGSAAVVFEQLFSKRCLLRANGTAVIAVHGMMAPVSDI